MIGHVFDRLMSYQVFTRIYSIPKIVAGSSVIVITQINLISYTSRAMLMYMLMSYQVFTRYYSILITAMARSNVIVITLIILISLTSKAMLIYTLMFYQVFTLLLLHFKNSYGKK